MFSGVACLTFEIYPAPFLAPCVDAPCYQLLSGIQLSNIEMKQSGKKLRSKSIPAWKFKNSDVIVVAETRKLSIKKAS